VINHDSIERIAASKLNDRFGKPLYDSYCFSQIPQTIYHLLTGDGDRGLPASVLGDLPDQYDKVILLFIDAFGWRFFEQYSDHYPFLKRFVDAGVVSKLTTQFPSTTAAHTTTIHTGLPVGTHGVYEWNYYEPLLDQIIAPLVFAYAGDERRETLVLPRRMKKEDLFPYPTFYQKLNAQGVTAYAIQPADFTPSSFSDVVTKGAKVSPYRMLSEGLVRLTDAVLAESGKAYFFWYVSSIDTAGHVYGPTSRQFAAEVDTVLMALERLLHAQLSGKLKHTLLLLTADHGQVEVSPETTIYLNQALPGIRRWIKTNDDGKLLVPAGAPRDMFLHIEDDCLDEVEVQLTQLLEGRAEVYRIQMLIDQGYFGPPAPLLQQRVGNLVILPYEYETVWWYKKGRFEQIFLGHHGGLTPGEMETVLLALPYP
jgi:hypothetical protein